MLLLMSFSSHRVFVCFVVVALVLEGLGTQVQQLNRRHLDQLLCQHQQWPPVLRDQLLLRHQLHKNQSSSQRSSAQTSSALSTGSSQWNEHRGVPGLGRI